MFILIKRHITSKYFDMQYFKINYIINLLRAFIKEKTSEGGSVKYIFFLKSEKFNYIHLIILIF